MPRPSLPVEPRVQVEWHAGAGRCRVGLVSTTDDASPSRWPWRGTLKDSGGDRRAAYAQLIEQAARFAPDYREHREAMATLQAMLAADQMDSAEAIGRTLARATWALAIATVALVLATVVLVVVTATQ